MSWASEALSAVLRLLLEHNPGARPKASALPDHRDTIGARLLCGFKRRLGHDIQMSVARGRKVRVTCFFLE